MTSIPLWSQLINLLAAVLLLLAFAMLAQRRELTLIDLFAAQGFALACSTGIVAFATRKDGQATLNAQWGGHPFLYEVDLFNETTPGDNVTLGNQGPATGTTNPFPVKAAQTYRLVLQNIETGFGATDMTASVSWP